MSAFDRLDDEVERKEGNLYLVPKREWVELQDYEGEMVLSCENPVEVEP